MKGLKLVHERIWKTLEDVTISDYFLYLTPTAQKIRTRIDKWACIKI
jgi:hypothetical protein